MIALLDERSSPPMRHLLGRLLSAERADFAVTHVRLAAVNLSEDEGASIGTCRFLLARLDAGGLPGAHAGVADSRTLGVLKRLVEGGRIEIRSAGLDSWHPDFSIFRGVPGPGAPRAVCLVGAHYFGSPPAVASLTCILADAAAIDRAQERFDQLWSCARDVGGVIIDSIERLAARGA